MNTKYKILSECEWLGHSPTTQITTLSDSSELVQFDSGSNIFEPTTDPQTVYLLSTGRVKVYRLSSTGSEFTLGYIRPQEVFGELFLFSDQGRQSYAQATSKSEVLKISKIAIETLLHTDPLVVIGISKQIARRLKELQTRAEDLAFRQSEARVARVILDLILGSRQQLANDSLMDIEVTVQDLANLSGLSRPTASIAVSYLVKNGYLNKTAGKLEITSVSKLQSLFAG